MDRIEVRKGRRVMAIYAGERLLKTYPISLGGRPTGPKRCRGDQRTPEGSYRIRAHKKNSSAYRALWLSYPEARDQANASRLNCHPGGYIMIHGIPRLVGWVGKLHRFWDWTAGCIAVTNPEMDELFGAVKNGATVLITP